MNIEQKKTLDLAELVETGFFLGGGWGGFGCEQPIGGNTVTIQVGLTNEHTLFIMCVGGAWIQ